jgi:serine/threonine protein kinase
MTLVSGSVVHNRYRIEQLLGSGGMGAVYRAYDMRLHQLVAVKENIGTIPGVRSDVNEARRRQFEREASVLASLHHPNIPGVVDHFVTAEGNQYLVMDYIDGEDMAQILVQKGPLSETEAIAWIGQVCNALGYLHRHNPPIVHRDIKPQNIKVTPKGQVFLVDFGIAKVGGTDSKTTKGALSVTPGFSPPEQYAMIGTDIRSDIYSLGATVYALLTGQVPPDSVSLQSGEVQLVPPRQMNATISSTVQQAVLKAMETRRSDRTQTVTEFWRMLSAASGELEAKTVVLADQGAIPKAGAWGKRDDLAEKLGLRRIPGSLVWAKNNLRLILPVIGAIIVLAVALALSLSTRPSQSADGGTTVPAVAIQLSPTETATQIVATPSPEAVVTRTEVALSQTTVIPIISGGPAAATGTAEARAMATQKATDEAATRQAARLLDCDKIDFEILRPPNAAQTVVPGAVNVVNVGLTWHVKNKATEFACQWGQAGEESQILRALLVGGSGNTGSPVKLKWIQDDEYDLSLVVLLSPGYYALSWRLVLPKTSLPQGPALAAQVVVGPLTVYPTQTPTVTPCPTISYPCGCIQVCSPRGECTKECDTCTKEVCPAMTATPTPTATRAP